MTTSEPTTGNIAKALRVCFEKTCACSECPFEHESCGNIEQLAADRLESQERELSGITGELEQYKKWHDESIATATNNIVELEHRVADLTARAEQAEENMPWVRIDGWDYFCQVKIFDPKSNQVTVNDKKYGWHTVGYEKIREWRGLPQDGEGK